MDFFITGMPRSKTAWFSAYFTHDNFICHHEQLANEGLISILIHKESDLIREGISDSALLNCWEDITISFSRSKWIIIEREFKECRASCLKFGISEHIIMSAKKQLDKMIEAKRDDPNCLILPFDFTPMQLEQACDHIGMQYDHRYSTEMMRMNIQMTIIERDRLRTKLKLT